MLYVNMNKIFVLFFVLLIQYFMDTDGVIYTYEDVELRRIFPEEFPQDTVRKSGAGNPEHLGRYAEIKRYFKFPKDKINSHFEELVCHRVEDHMVCQIDADRYTPDEEAYLTSNYNVTNTDRRRVYCFMLLCFTEDELDRVASSFLLTNAHTN